MEEPRVVDVGKSALEALNECTSSDMYEEITEDKLISLIFYGVDDFADFHAYVEKLRAIPGSISRCSKGFSKQDAYRCKECAITPQSCICIDCFENGNHSGHHFTLISTGENWSCDCGDCVISFLVSELHVILYHEECAKLLLNTPFMMQLYFSILEYFHEQPFEKRVVYIKFAELLPKNELLQEDIESFPQIQESHQEVDVNDDNDKFYRASSIEEKLNGLFLTSIGVISNESKQEYLPQCFALCCASIDRINDLYGIYKGVRSFKFHPFELRRSNCGYNIPLHRILSIIVQNMTRLGKVLNFSSFGGDFVISLIEYPIRVLSLTAQIRSGFWNPNSTNFVRTTN